MLFRRLRHLLACAFQTPPHPLPFAQRRRYYTEYVAAYLLISHMKGQWQANCYLFKVSRLKHCCLVRPLVLFEHSL